MLAAQRDRVELVELFLVYGADVRVLDDNYKSAIHYAKKNSRLGLVRFCVINYVITTVVLTHDTEVVSEVKCEVQCQKICENFFAKFIVKHH